MARILISCFSPVFDNGAPKLTCMYEGFIKALCDQGNDVRVINTSVFLPRPWNGENQLFPTLDGKKLAADIKAFAPEVAFAFNHSIPDAVLEVLECPVVLWDSDSLPFYNDKAAIQKNIGRYHFFCFSRYGMENACRFGAAKSQVFFVPSATAVEAEAIPQKANISFIGTMFRNQENFRQFVTHFPDRAARDRIIALVKGGYANIDNPFIAEHRAQIEKYIGLSDLFYSYAPARRLDTLNSLAPFGLTIYGGTEWLEMAQFLPDLALAYDPTRIYSLRHNQDVYNSSRLCLNISHSQVVDGYAWRVLDVMASNGCLLSDRSSGISELLKGYIDLPMFESAAEARDLAQKILSDEPMRRDIVTASQTCIADKGRWSHRFPEIQAILSVPIVGVKSVGLGSVRFLDPKDYETSPGTIIAQLANPSQRRAALSYLVRRFPLTRRLFSSRLGQALRRAAGR